MNLKKAASAALVAAMTMSAAATTVMAVEASMPITAEDSTATVPDDVRDDTLVDTSSAVEDRAQGSATQFYGRDTVYSPMAKDFCVF